MSVMSIVALAVSIVGAVLYCTLFAGSGLQFLFIIFSIASIILPPIAKRQRLAKGKKGIGMGLEITAIVIGGFNFYCIFFALTSLPILIGYLGWVICIIAYKLVKAPEKQEFWADNDSIQQVSTDKKVCRKCGEPLLANCGICLKCGTNVEED